MLINSFQHAMGLDLGDRSIKFVQLSAVPFIWKKWRYKLQHASTLALPPGLIVDGEIQKPEEIIKLIKRHLNSAPGLIKTHWVVACLPEPKTYIQPLTLPADEKGRVSEADVLQMAPSYIPYDLNTIYLDWQVLSDQAAKNNQEKTVMLCAVPKVTADTFTYLLNIAGFTPLALEVEAMAITRAVINRGKDLTVQARGILDLGATRSSFIIYDKSMIQFSLSLPISGLKMTEEIQGALNIDFTAAEKLKISCGIDQKKSAGKLKIALEKNLQDLADKVCQAIQFYKLHFPENNPLTGIRLCGGGANLPAIEGYLSGKLKMKVRKANPWVNLFPPDKIPLSTAESLNYTTAIGLAMRALEKPIIL